jgi:hypothetical protein
MSLPHLDPNLVLWTDLVSNVVVVVASSGAFAVALRHYLYALRRDAAALSLKGDEDAKAKDQ